MINGIITEKTDKKSSKVDFENPQYNEMCLECERKCKQYAWVTILKCPLFIPKKARDQKSKNEDTPD
jgi:hypothetical protein